MCLRWKSDWVPCLAFLTCRISLPRSASGTSPCRKICITCIWKWYDEFQPVTPSAIQLVIYFQLACWSVKQLLGQSASQSVKSVSQSLGRPAGRPANQLFVRSQFRPSSSCLTLVSPNNVNRIHFVMTGSSAVYSRDMLQYGTSAPLRWLAGRYWLKIRAPPGKWFEREITD